MSAGGTALAAIPAPPTAAARRVAAGAGKPASIFLLYSPTTFNASPTNGIAYSIFLVAGFTSKKRGTEKLNGTIL